MAVKRNPISVIIDQVDKVTTSIKDLASKRVYVGVPSETANVRPSDETRGYVNNAFIGYYNEHGDPLHNLPARPWLVPGVKSVQDETITMLKRIAKDGLEKGPSYVDKGLHAVGILNADAAKNLITEGLSPPLAPRTVENRKRRHKHRKGEAADMRPLIDTAAFLNSITHVIRRKS